MLPPVALQLYSVREAAQQDFVATVERVAAMGYAGVEPSSFPGITPADAAKLFRDLGLAVPSVHLPLPLGDAKDEALATMEALGCTRLISGFGPDAYASVEQIQRTCDLFNQAAAVARANGLSLGIHNHWWEYTPIPGLAPVEGRLPYQIALDYLDEDIFFELDTYWAQTAGADVIAVVRELGDRAPLLHIKDGPANRTDPMTAVGDGVMDFPAILGAAAGAPQWLIVELDRCATDMLVAVERSCAYLVDNGLGRGRAPA